MRIWIPILVNSFTGILQGFLFQKRKKISAMMHTEAEEGGLLKTMSEDELKRFTPSKLLLYMIASEYRYIPVHTSTY